MLTHLLPMLQEASGTALEYSTSAEGSLGIVGTLVMLAIVVVMIAAVESLHQSR